MLATLLRQMIYYPEVEQEERLLQMASGLQLRDWRNHDGELIGWHTPTAGTGARRLVVFHGNAGHALYRHYYAAGMLGLDRDWQVFLFEYPGYGARRGSPSESDIK